MRPRGWLTLAVAAYTPVMAAVIGPEPWMWTVWLGVGLVLAAVLAGLLVLRRELQPEEPLRPLVAGAVPPLVATLSFAVIAVQAAVLETGGYADLETTYWLLGLGMVGVVALYLASYERSRFRQKES